MTKLLSFLLICFVALLSPAPVAESPEVLDLYAYHLRVVRVTGAGADGGAALGWNSDDGEPVVLPAYEGPWVSTRTVLKAA